ncbi:diguanylate cyclase domain-containing protein [Actinoplanes sp. NPDC051859]|uniref:diguanylate cyclase domain-containing protein n=1 Tax=Actinoplanes sp. NPDC051859 TaxID=3363909 RepID=UPI00378F04CA
MSQQGAARPMWRADPVVTGLLVLILGATLGLGPDLAPLVGQVHVFWFILLVAHLALARSSWRVSVYAAPPPGAGKAEAARGRAGQSMWKLFAVAGGVLVLGDICQLVAVVQDPLAPEAAAGTGTQMLSIGIAMGLIVIGILRYPLGEMGAAEKLRLRVDVATVMAAAFTFGLWLTDLPSGEHDTAWYLRAAVMLAVQPGIFLVLIFAVIKIVLGGQSPFIRSAAILGGLAAILQAVLQAVPLTMYVEQPTMSWLFAANVLASGLVAIGVRLQERRVRAALPVAERVSKRPYSLLPYGAMAAVWALAGVVLAVHGLDPRTWVVAVGALVTTALVVGRQVAAFRHVAELLRERDELTAQLTQLAFHDGLTKLANRGLFMRRLHDSLAAGSATVFLIDLDDFKPVNDAHGHATGDQLLIEVGRRLRACVRDGDTVARLGGDEFAVLMDEVSADRRGEVHDILARALSGEVRLGSVSVPLRASIGMATGRHGLHHPDSLLHEADMAMYAAKDRRRALLDSDRA